MRLRWPNVFALLTLPAAAQAQAPRELVCKLPDKPTTVAYLQPVIAPTALAMTVHDGLGWLLVAHRAPTLKDPPLPAGKVWPQLALHRLDAAGKPGEPKNIALPKPPALAKQANYPLAVAFHPKLPLLYVWQDIEPILPRAEATDQPAYREFDHLLIYHIDSADPELLFSCARGDRFALGMQFGSLALDASARRLFAGNLQYPAPKDVISGAVGYFELAADGLPEFDVEPRMPAGDRAGRIAVARALAAKVQPNAGIKRVTPDKTGYLWSLPCGLGLLPFSPDVLLFGGPSGPVVWDLGNRRGELAFNFIPPYYRPANLGNLDRLIVHPTLPVFYGGIVFPEEGPWADSYMYCMEHADGYPTLFAQRATLAGFRISSPPVLLAKHKRLAFGGDKRVALVALDAEGKLTTERIEAEVDTPRIRALAYSNKYDRLYVAVAPPEPASKEVKK